MKVPNFIRPTTDGRLAEQTRNASFWQSRMTRGGRLSQRPELIDIGALAREVRRAAHGTPADEVAA